MKNSNYRKINTFAKVSSRRVAAGEHLKRVFSPQSQRFFLMIDAIERVINIIIVLIAISNIIILFFIDSKF